MGNQHLTTWRCLSSTQRHARKLISGPISTTKARFLSFNRIKSRIVIGLPILRKHLHLMGLTSSPLYRRFGVKEETPAPILCDREECESLASLRHVYQGSFFLDPQDIKNLSPGAISNFIIRTRLS